MLIITRAELKDRGDFIRGFPQPDIRGCALDGSRLSIERERRRNEEVLAKVKKAGSWAVNDDLESTSFVHDFVYSLPLNVMVSARRATLIHTPITWAKGPKLEEETPDRERRDAYRTSHRDGTDPLQAVVKSSRRSLPSPVKEAQPLFLAYAYRPIIRTLGIFDSYDEAVATAPVTATIVELPADGRTGVNDGKKLRGVIRNKWGYASGYAPHARRQSQVRA